MTIVKRAADLLRRVNQAVLDRAGAALIAACEREAAELEREIAETEAVKGSDHPHLIEAKAGLARMRSVIAEAKEL